jgi:hypothetical protein
VWAAAEAQGKALYEELLQVHGESVRREQERAEAGFAARRRMIERLGLHSVRSAQLRRLSARKGSHPVNMREASGGAEAVPLAIVGVEKNAPSLA